MKRKDPFTIQKPGPLPESKLGELARYANLLKLQQSKVEGLEEQLKQAKKSLQQIEEEAIPSYMQELGLSSVNLLDGSKISVSTKIYAVISQGNHEEAMSWLINNGHEDIIKLTVTGTFGKEEYKLAKQIYEKLQKEGAKVTSKEGVHPSTLASFLKEQLEKGTPIPLETFGARSVTKAQIT